MSQPYLASMTDKELAHYAEVMLDSMLSSALEIELTKRFARLVDTSDARVVSELTNERNHLARLLRFKIKPTVTDPNVLVAIDEALAPYTMEKSNAVDPRND